MDIFDIIPAHTIVEGDQIAHNNDYLEVTKVVDDGGVILIQGFSHISGDTATYLIEATKEVGLWSA